MNLSSYHSCISTEDQIVLYISWEVHILLSGAIVQGPEVVVIQQRNVTSQAGVAHVVVASRANVGVRAERAGSDEAGVDFDGRGGAPGLPVEGEVALLERGWGL